MKIQKRDVVPVLEWLVNHGHCPALIFDDQGRWCVSGEGVQNVGNDKTLWTSFTVHAKDLHKTIVKAVEHYLADHDWKKSELLELRRHIMKARKP